MCVVCRRRCRRWIIRSGRAVACAWRSRRRRAMASAVLVVTVVGVMVVVAAAVVVMVKFRRTCLWPTSHRTSRCASWKSSLSSLAKVNGWEKASTHAWRYRPLYIHGGVCTYLAPFKMHNVVENVKILPQARGNQAMSAFVDFTEVPDAKKAHESELVLDGQRLRSDYNIRR